MKRCPWSEGFKEYRQYHDEEWGVPLRDSRMLFELLMLEGAQAGLSWATILKKRDNYRLAFDNFDPVKIASYKEEDQARLMNNEGIVRNSLKISGVVKGSNSYLALQALGIRFEDFVWQFVGNKPIQNFWRKLDEVPTRTFESDNMSCALKKVGFTFVGSTICYAFMQASGMVNDHLINCPWHQIVSSTDSHLVANCN
ncbi:DNA-3-methyladenine glycosylase I [Candidatus Pandoraea novymonadis]|uniref:DNA-3-methyladenine glycosylase 1 n=1 Tax=Candidatus Pandoraea novymonadis TaxID=1808959 RepID=A0ABX5FFK3_9BURK|nr:DNA-3-methyladenine glycosylase I [Candidatus Pandoraea novymonadis]PSB92131.1 DNA-3-methyladenine glycosylase 1 [Candidatus Pandoraea novymonadis]